MCTPVFIAALLTIAKIWMQRKCPSINKWIKKIWYILIHTANTQVSILVSWLQSPSAVILEPKIIKSVIVSIVQCKVINAQK